MVEVGEHYRAKTDGHEPGIYRVVGVPGEVTLLRVTDGDGRRISSGRVVRTSPEALAEKFEPAPDPDAGFAPVRTVRNLGSGLYWSVRRFLP